jgi:CheY-like chemotaxis protein
MPDGIDGLKGMRILVVEDEYLIALDIGEALQRFGCEMLGPASTVATALDVIRQSDRLDGALLDLNLHGEVVLPVAEALVRADVPFVLTTGYPARASEAAVLREARRLRKPYGPKELAAAISETFAGRSS